MFTIPELQEQLQCLTKKTKISYTEIGKALGCGRSNISQRAKNKSPLTFAELKRIDSYFNVNLLNKVNTFKSSFKITDDNYSNNSITIDYYPDVIASCGPGGFEMSQECIQYNVPATLFPPARNAKGYSMCHAKGNSMYPRIWDGDFVICEHKDNMKIENGEMYIFCFDDQIYLKRLTKNINQIVVESENPDFPTQYIEKEDMNNVHLIGHVVCSGRMNGKYLDKRI